MSNLVAVSILVHISTSISVPVLVDGNVSVLAGAIGSKQNVFGGASTSTDGATRFGGASR